MKKTFNRLLEKFLARFYGISAALLSLMPSIASAYDNKVWEGDIDKGLEVLDTAVTLSVVIGIVIVACGFVLGGIRYMKDDMQGGKDVIVKCFVAGIVVIVAPVLVKFMIGAFDIGGFKLGGKNI